MTSSPSSQVRSDRPPFPRSVSEVVRDEGRLEALEEQHILDTDPEPAFDRVARLAADMLGTEFAIVNFVGEDRQWFKSALGLEADETGLDVSFCVYTVEKGEAFVVEDLATDERFADNPFVTERGIRFYAGVPLETEDGYRIGTLCVLDTEPHAPSQEALRQLSDLGAIVEDELELRRTRAEHRQARADLARSQELLHHAQQLANVGGWTYDPQAEELTWTDQMYRIHGLPPDAEMGLDGALDFFTEESRPVFESHFERLLDEGGRFDLELSIETAEGERRRIRTIGEAHRADGETIRIDGAIQEITERKEQERDREQRYEAIFNQTYQFAGLMEPDGTLIEANETALEFGGLDPEDVLGKPFWKAHWWQVSEETQQELREAIDRAAEGEFVRYEVDVKGEDGVITIDFSIRPVTDEDGNVTYLIPEGRNITELKVLQKQKRELERYRTIVENLPVGVFRSTPEGELMSMNSRFASLFNTDSKAQLRDYSAQEFWADPAERSELMEEIQKKGVVKGKEARLETLDGEPRWMEVTIALTEEEEGRSLVGILQDVTERREREKRLRMLSEAVAQAKEAVLITEAEPIDEPGPRIVYVNEAFEEMTGYAEEEILGETPRILQGPETERAVLDRLREALEAGELWEGETINYRKDGTPYRVQWALAPVGGEEEAIEYWVSVQRDVTEEWEREAALRRSRRRYRSLFEDSTDAILVHDLDGTVQEVNPQAESLFGAPAEELQGRSLAELHVPSEAKTAREKLNALRNSGAYEAVSQYERADGSVFWAEVVANKTDLGDETMIRSLIRDVSDRVESRRELERYRAYTGRLLDAIEDLFFAVDEEGQLRRWNKSVPEVTGYADEEIQEMTAFDFVPESEHERVAATITEAIETGHGQVEVPLLRKDGTRIPYEFMGNLVEHPDGGLRAVGIGRDVTERRRRKQRLERLNDLFAKAQDLASVGAWEYDVESDQSVLTEEVYRIHGLSPDADLPPERSIGFYHPDDRPRIREAFRRAVEDGMPYDLELRLITDTGEHRWVRTRGEPQHENGEVVRVRGVIQDVTEEVQHRLQLKGAKETAEEADRIKTALLSNMNHEFRTPLTSIISFSEVIAEHPSLAEKFAGRILGGGKRLLYTLNTVMEFAELEGEGPSVTPKPTPLGELLRSVASELRERAEQQGIELSVEVSDAVGTAVLDEHLVERILTHLLHNAVKFTDDGEVTASVQTQGEMVEFRVEDTGVGIDPGFMPRIFDEFAQQSSGYDRTHEGNGLGLTIVQRLASEMEGTVEIDSEPGEGTTVIVRVPPKS